ncbi:MAG TPA: glutaredoxin family protein [Candidatus Saccharimonadales bacterium]|nr:glutaredoxin family protein [Candidatus Saccharimonadales bacterium]
MTVTLYSTTTCTFCVQLEQWFTRQGVTYTKILLDQNPAVKNQVIAQSGFRSVPITQIDRGDATQFVLGFDVPRLQQALAAEGSVFTP